MMPVLFVGHGNPMYAIEENGFTKEWQILGQKLPKPKAVVIISAHWETNGTFITAMENPRTIHDFYGFPQTLFDIQYKCPGDPALATQIIENIKGFAIKPDLDWGLDHGSWSVLKHIYPTAEIPVIQISLDRNKTPSEHFQLAKQLNFLREQDILIIGSGNMVHNLRLIDFRRKDGSDWAIAANEQFKELILNEDFDKIIEFEEFSGNLALAVPTAEHFLPLIYVLALKNENDEIRIFNDAVDVGSISMTSVTVG